MPALVKFLFWLLIDDTHVLAELKFIVRLRQQLIYKLNAAL